MAWVASFPPWVMPPTAVDEYAGEEAAPSAEPEAPAVVEAAAPAEKAQRRHSLRVPCASELWPQRPEAGRRLRRCHGHSRRHHRYRGPAAAAPARAAEEVVTPAVKDTIERAGAGQDRSGNAITGSTPLKTSASGETPAAEPADGELYVVEDKVIRGRQSRILSDGTVEAETDEGWMRFENLEHLDEYLDAVGHMPTPMMN